MLKNVQDYPSPAHIETDICIVGAGAAGIAIAREFLHQSGTEVLLIESGGNYPNAEINQLNQAQSIGYIHDGAMDGRNRSLGGTTVLWAGQCIRMDEIDFAQRPWIPESGWPITLADLNPFYERAEAFFGLENPVYGDAVWPPFGVAPPNVDPEKLFYQSTLWCPETDMGKRYRHELVASANVTILLNATVTQLHTNPVRSQVTHLAIQSLNGHQGTVCAKVFILACGGIENPRLLLLSDNLGNDYDLVGRYFQEHPNATCANIVTDHPRPIQDALGLLYNRKTGVRYLPRFCLNPKIQEQQQTLNAACYLVFQYPDASAASAARNLYRGLRQGQSLLTMGGDLKRLVLDFGTMFHLLYRRYGRGLSAGTKPEQIRLHAYLEQAPNSASRITLAQDRDALGLRLPCIDWRLTDLERRTTRAIADVIQAEFHRLGVGDVKLDDWLLDEQADWSQQYKEAFHHMGTTRMANHPQHGVVDANCQVHGVDNLFIAGSSVFPTGGYANPTLTLVALALRLSDQIKFQLGKRSKSPRPLSTPV